MKSWIALAVGGTLLLAAFIVFSFSVGTTQQSSGKMEPTMVKRGEYLVTLGGCNDCHSPNNSSQSGRYHIKTV